MAQQWESPRALERPRADEQSMAAMDMIPRGPLLQCNRGACRGALWLTEDADELCCSLCAHEWMVQRALINGRLVITGLVERTTRLPDEREHKALHADRNAESHLAALVEQPQ